MNVLFLEQMYIFLVFIICGIIIGIIFDIFRILRKSFKTPDFVTYIEDILFWIMTCILFAYSIFTYNNGEIRLYIFIAAFIGILIYILTISKYFINFCVKVINIVKTIINKLIINPIKKIWKLLKGIIFKPIFIVYISLRKVSRNIFKKICKNNAKKGKSKKEFT